jgi:hypothetical protein
MPWAAHRVPNHETFAERAAIVRAGRADREHFRAAPRQQHSLFADLPDKHPTVRQITLRNSSGKVGLILGCIGHMDLPVAQPLLNSRQTV